MIEGSIKIQSTSVEITQLKARAERQALAYRSSKPSQNTIFNRQENQIIDDVNISDAAIKQLEQARSFNNKLEKYLDYLKGNNQNKRDVRLILQNRNDEQISARVTSFDASITAGKITGETLEIDFTLNDIGNLTDLTIGTSKTTTEFVSSERTLSDTQFYYSRT